MAAAKKKGPPQKGRKPGAVNRTTVIGPQDEKQRIFCERWLIHFDKDRAWREAGYSVNNASQHGSKSLLERMAEYLRPIREAKAKIMAERLAVSAEKIIEGMSQKVFFDPTSFYERSTQPLTHVVKELIDGKSQDVERVKMWDGQPIYGERLKPFSDLTAEQQAVVEITSAAGEQIKYRLPNIREQHAYFTSLGKQIGMFTDKLIVERHNHRHTHAHAHLDFSNVPTQQLASLTRQMLPLVSLEHAQALGFTPEDVQEARDQGVLMPDKSTA